MRSTLAGLCAVSGGCVALLLLLNLATPAASHGFMTAPRSRGGFNCQRNVKPKVINPRAPVDYCPHCLNAGGVKKVRDNTYAGRWRKYEPLKGNHRGGFGICGDPVGGYDHMKGGKFADPSKGDLVAKRYTAGQVANFEFDATANHGGYLEFYLCDVENNKNQDISFDSFPRDCVYLERVKHHECESGNDRTCGPVDPEFPGRWVLPCRYRAGDQGDQILGGENGKMAYKIPDGIDIKVGVIQMYWLVSNSCQDPDGFMKNYNYPRSWNGCEGDGGAIGGKPQHHQSCDEPGKFPEEFWNCADVVVEPSGRGGGGGGMQSQYSGNSGGMAPRSGNTGGGMAPLGNTGGGQPRATGGSDGNGRGTRGGYQYYDAYADGNSKEDGRCSRSGSYCKMGETRCCRSGDVCAQQSNGSPKCVKLSSLPATISGGNGGSVGGYDGDDNDNNIMASQGGGHGHGHGGMWWWRKGHGGTVKEDGNCIRDYQHGCHSKRCCREEARCVNNQCRR